MMAHLRNLRIGIVALWSSVILMAGAGVQPSAVAAQVCTGDCSGDGFVTVDEIVTMVNIALGAADVSTCPAADPSGDSHVTVDEILQAVSSALEGCPPVSGCTMARVTVRLDFDAQAAAPAGITAELDYPTDRVSIPGAGDDPQVVARVTDLTGLGGFFSVFDRDSDSNGTEDQLGTSVVVIGASYSPGPFEEALFDCNPGAELPAADDFGCSIASASDEFGNAIDAGLIGCSVTVAAP
jgi:hypothetical protein